MSFSYLQTKKFGGSNTMKRPRERLLLLLLVGCLFVLGCVVWRSDSRSDILYSSLYLLFRSLGFLGPQIPFLSCQFLSVYNYTLKVTLFTLYSRVTFSSSLVPTPEPNETLQFLTWGYVHHLLEFVLLTQYFVLSPPRPPSSH